MRWSAVVVYAAPLLALVATTVHAQPAPDTTTTPEQSSPPPPPPPSEPAPPLAPEAPPSEPPLPVEPTAPAPSISVAAAYPLSYAARPLALPAGGFETTALFEWFHVTDVVDSFSLIPSARMAVDQVELDAAAGIHLASNYKNTGGVPDPEVDRLISLSVGARYSLDPDLQLGAAFVLTTPTSDTSHSYTPSAFIETRRHLAPRAAVDLKFSAGYSHYTYEPLAMAPFPSQSLFAFTADAQVIAQVQESVAVQARAVLVLNKPIDQMFGTYGTATTSLGQRYSVGLVVAASRSLDFLATANLPYVTSKEFLVGVAGRGLP